MFYTHKQLLKMHGKRCTCKIEGEQITDAKIVVEDDEVYICQNKINGGDANNKLGYKYSWIISRNDDRFENNNEDVTDLKIKNRTIKDGLFEGDIVVGSYREKMVLGVCGKVYFMSSYSNFTKYGAGYTLEELIEYGYKLKQEEPEEETVEMTMEEVCEKLGINVKIKKEE